MAENKSQDPRVRRTKNRLQKALMELIIEKGYQSLTVQEIVDRADVNRTTFYRQFQDKDDLMRFVIDDMVDQILTELEKPKGQKKYDFTFVTAKQLAGLFKCAAKHKDLFKALVNEKGTPAFHYHFIKTFETVLHKRIEQSGINMDRFPIPISMVVTYLTNAYVAVLNWWLSHHDEYSAEFVAEKIVELMLDGIYNFLDPTTKINTENKLENLKLNEYPII
ncbi:MAG: TetR/AcrR family transcriptional regulator [Chloroflexota bacterium]|jgi:AcrR family transcriptional regulator|nr:TetR/AcrR family transcriptional regulator [Chloroflexota bacterium]